MNIIETSGLGKRYGSTWALRECSLAVPAGHVAALVGPNGAGKTTLLKLAVGLAAPTAGTVTVLGGRTPGSPAALDGIAFVAQDAPLYKNMPAADMLHLTRNLNRRFDQRYAETRLAEFGIPLSRRAGKLSGGQQAQLALTLALARLPRLLLLDGLGHLAAAPLRAGRSGRAAGRAGGVPVARRPSGAPRLRRSGRLPPGRLGYRPLPASCAA